MALLKFILLLFNRGMIELGMNFLMGRLQAVQMRGDFGKAVAP
jgi:hypothetical protein